MSVYIKGMEMPTDGELLCINIYPDGKVIINLDLNCKQVATAAPVPPHGRLGDLDRLESELRNMAKYQSGYRQQGIFGCCETIRLATTIIPPEEGE